MYKNYFGKAQRVKARHSKLRKEFTGSLYDMGRGSDFRTFRVDSGKSGFRRKDKKLFGLF